MPSPPPLSSPSRPAVATGRLGRVRTCAIVDDAVGTMLGAVQHVDAPSISLATVLRDALAEELGRWSVEIDHPHVFQYDSVRLGVDGRDTPQVELQASHAVSKHLHSLLREFGRLHTSVARHVLRSAVSGLAELQRRDRACGGLSLSNLFLSEGRVQVAAWFPSITCLHQLNEAHPGLFVDNPFALSVLRRHGSTTIRIQQERDVRSLAFLLVELLTGVRVGLSLVAAGSDGSEELSHLLAHHPMERAFALDVLQEGVNLQSLATHPYLLDATVSSTSTLPAAVALSQRALVAHLIDEELRKCRDQQRGDAHHVRVWLTQFEKRFNRKPHPDERPASIQRLQQRCRALHDRIFELERRMKVLGHMAPHFGDMLAAAAVCGGNARSTSPPKALASMLDIDTTVRGGSEDGEIDLADMRRRSPAQNAFLRRVSYDHGAAKPSLTAIAPARSPHTNSLLNRERAHELIHQRKEVMQVIGGLEQPHES